MGGLEWGGSFSTFFISRGLHRLPVILSIMDLPAPHSSVFIRLQIIQVNLTSEDPRPLVEGSTLDFSYSVKWQQTNIPFRRRFERYLDYNFFEHQVLISNRTC